MEYHTGAKPITSQVLLVLHSSVSCSGRRTSGNTGKSEDGRLGTSAPGSRSWKPTGWVPLMLCELQLSLECQYHG